MPSVVQLNRLRSQLNAVANHFGQGDEFFNALKALLDYYGDHKLAVNQRLKEPSNMLRLHVPPSVLLEVNSRLQILAKGNPNSAIDTADQLWASNIYEIKSGAIAILSSLSSIFQDQVISRISVWISPQLDSQLLHEIQQGFEANPDILLNKEWIKTLSNWLAVEDDELKRMGLRALKHTIQLNFENLPQIFSLLTPIIQQPSLPIQKELLEVIKSLIQRSEAETASFLIMAGTLYPQNNILAFIRKCLPFFDSYFETEIRSALT